MAVICLWAWRGCYNVAESTKEGCSKAHYETPQRRRRLDAAAAAFRAPAQPPSLLLWKVLASTLPSLRKLHIFNNLARGATSKPSEILFLQKKTLWYSTSWWFWIEIPFTKESWIVQFQLVLDWVWFQNPTELSIVQYCVHFPKNQPLSSSKWSKFDLITSLALRSTLLVN